MRALMLLPVDSQPRLIKRVNQFILKYDVVVAYQVRDYFKKNKIPENCLKIKLNKIENGSYHKRIFKLFTSFAKIRKLKYKYDVICSFSFDLLIISMFIKCDYRIYEIGDIRRIKWKVFDLLYRFLLNRQNKIIVTSNMFAEYLIKKYKIPSSKIKIIENKLNPELFSTKPIPKLKFNDRKIKVGIIGLLRYRQIIDFLSVIVHNENLEVYIYGSGPLSSDILKFVNDKNIFYHGEFEYPKDLEEIYSKIDLSFVMYDSNELNVRLALPNKLYESIYFNVPLIVSSNTYLSKKVEEYGVGFSYNIQNISELPLKINEIVKNGMFVKYSENCKKIERTKIFINETDHPIL
ncbi:MAG TPA: glycosyltransferase [Salinimicrobium sp.]|nr:glycosyltransferase [Salinimicrobium sp.]